MDPAVSEETRRTVTSKGTLRQQSLERIRLIQAVNLLMMTTELIPSIPNDVFRM